MTNSNNDINIRLTILSIMADMDFKSNEERYEYAEWALGWVTPEPVSNENNVTSLKGLN